MDKYMKLYDECSDFKEYVDRLKQNYYSELTIEEILQHKIVKEVGDYYISDNRIMKGGNHGKEEKESYC